MIRMIEIGLFLCRTAKNVSHRILNTFPFIFFVLLELLSISIILKLVVKIGTLLYRTAKNFIQCIANTLHLICIVLRQLCSILPILISITLKLRGYQGVALLVFFIIPATVWAVDDTFTISFEMDPDTEAPSVPLNLAALPISFDQVDLTWDASTDNHAVYGYQVFRDGVQIATTSSSTIAYSDFPLQQATTYAYQVTAFDISDNVSGKSATSTVTTYPASSGESTYASTETLDVDDWQVDTTEDTITITFTTDEAARAALRWGETGLLEDGYVAVEIYRDEHKLIITGLDPDTGYNLDLFLQARFGGPSYQTDFFVRTAPGPDKTPPQNVMNFEAVYRAGATELRWNNSPDSDFDRVRIVVSDSHFPTDIADGRVVYEGSGERARDVWGGNGIRYYSAFAIDKDGNVSSGAVAVVKAGDYTDILTSTPIVVDGKIIPFSFSDLVIAQSQGSQRYTEGKTLAIYQGEPTKFAIAYSVLPERLKTIVTTLTNEEGASFSFLLRVDDEKEWYEAVVGSMPEPGKYEVAIEVYDFKTKSMTRVEGGLTVIPAPETGELPKEVILPYFIYAWALSLVLVLVSVLWYRREV
tara:strand:- start:429 stop:2186 length:1758 start_codon:yes stop_codon:yes gene_type:complete